MSIKMFTSPILAVALASIVNAMTPDGFGVTAKKDLTVAFGSALATNGKVIPKAGETSSTSYSTRC